MRPLRRLLSAAVLGWLCVAAAAQTPEPTAAELLKRVEKLEQAAQPKGPTVGWTGQLQADAVSLAQDAAHVRRFGDTPDGLVFRRARIGMLPVYGPLEARIEMDFAFRGRPSFLDVYAQLRDVPGLGLVRVGHFFEPFGLERVTANRFVTFLERSLIDEAFNPARNLGGMVRDTYAGDRGTLAVGVFASDSDIHGDSFGRPGGVAGTARLTGLPVFDDDGATLLHLGVGYSARQPRDGLLRFRARPELRLAATDPNIPNVADTGPVRSPFFQLINLEVLTIRGPLSVQAEWTAVPVQVRSAGTAVFMGAYAEAAWLLTGEHRPYRRDNGTVDRLIPRRPFVGAKPGEIGSGPGAVELAVRVSYLDLDAGSIRGGRVTDVTLGANWYLNPYLRVTANYIHSVAESLTAPTAASDGVGLRLGFDF